jgi:hypothetical protein
LKKGVRTFFNKLVAARGGFEKLENLTSFFLMGCPALGIWVGFLKQPTLPGKAPPKKNSSKKILKNKNHK